MKYTVKKLLIVLTTILAVSTFSSCTQSIEDDLFSQIIEDSQNGKDKPKSSDQPEHSKKL